MAAPKKGRSASAQSKPGRSLALILIAMVALTGGMFLSGHTTPRLGIDLAGGTSITLRAVAEPGQESAINKTNMDTAVDIMNRRVNGLGVSEAEVQTQGDANIIVNIPKGTNSEEARKQVGTTAKLYFRPVARHRGLGRRQRHGHPVAERLRQRLERRQGHGQGDLGVDSVHTATPSATATSQGRAVTDALKADADAVGAAAASARSQRLPVREQQLRQRAPTTKLEAAVRRARLHRSKAPRQGRRRRQARPTPPSPAARTRRVSGRSTCSARPRSTAPTSRRPRPSSTPQTAAGWTVTMDFTGKGTKKFADITGKLAQNQPPQNQFAIVLDGDVVSDPSVSQALTGGNAEISGSFNQE